MSREATSFEAVVKNLSLDDDGVTEWAQLSWWRPVETTSSEHVRTAAGVMATECFSASIHTSRLPGVKLGDKVQVALYLK